MIKNEAICWLLSNIMIIDNKISQQELDAFNRVCLQLGVDQDSKQSFLFALKGGKTKEQIILLGREAARTLAEESRGEREMIIDELHAMAISDGLIKEEENYINWCKNILLFEDEWEKEVIDENIIIDEDFTNLY